MGDNDYVDLNKVFEKAHLENVKQLHSIPAENRERRRRWIINTFMDMLNVDLIKNNAIRGAVINMNVYKSHMRRYEKWNILYTYIMVPGINGMICSIVDVVKNDKTVNVGYIYSAIHPVSNKVVPLYMCTGVNMVSTDGEYRGRFIRMNNLNLVYFTNIEFITDIENHIHIKDYKCKVHHFHTLGTIPDLNNHIDTYIIKVIVVVWFCEMYLIHFKLQNNHKNPDFNNVIFDDTDIKFFNMLIEKYSLDMIYTFYRRCTTVLYPGSWGIHGETIKVTSKNTSIGIECGQKLIPLKIRDVIGVMNPIQRIWREVIIWKMLSNLPLNLITPGIPIYNLWFSINNSQIHVFNNPNMIKKHQSSTPLDGGEQKTNLSNITAAIICESTGSTVNNTLLFRKSIDYVQKNKDLFSHPTYFMKYLFEITYTLYCMNTKMGIIHNDLHLNNTTLNSMYYPYFNYDIDILNVKPEPNDRVVYHIGSELYYWFPHIIKYGTVIDFSRSIIKIKYIEQHLPSPTDKKIFISKQNASIMGWYAMHLPDLFTEYQNEIKKACDTRFDVVFKLLSAIDMYYHAVLLLKFINNQPGILKHESVNNTLKKIVTISRHYLETGMRHLAQDINWVCDEWPNLDIIKRCFSDHIIDLSKPDEIKKYTVVDFFNYDNPLKFDFHDPTKTPIRFSGTKYANKKWGEDGYKTDVDLIDSHIQSNQHTQRTTYNKSVEDWVKLIRATTKTTIMNKSPVINIGEY